MSHRIRVREFKKLNLEGGYLIDGFPSVGFTSAIATESMVHTSQFSLVGVISSESFPPISLIREGKPNFVGMEKELVKDIAGQLDIMITDETEAAIQESATEDMSAARLYSLGLKYIDRYEYKKAYEHFKMAYEKDNTFSEAKKKMEIYKPLIG